MISLRESDRISELHKTLIERIKLAKVTYGSGWGVLFDKGDTERSPNILSELVALYQKGSAFLITCEISGVSNTFLVAPPACKEYNKLSKIWVWGQQPVVYPLDTGSFGKLVDGLKSCADIIEWVVEQTLKPEKSIGCWLSEEDHFIDKSEKFRFFKLHEMPSDFWRKG
jgi:hypothetical protein